MMSLGESNLMMQSQLEEDDEPLVSGEVFMKAIEFKKQRADKLIFAKDYRQALDYYLQIIEEIGLRSSDEIEGFRLKVLSNMTLCHLKIKEFACCLELGGEVLNEDPCNLKIYLRCAVTSEWPRHTHCKRTSTRPIRSSSRRRPSSPEKSCFWTRGIGSKKDAKKTRKRRSNASRKCSRRNNRLIGFVHKIPQKVSFPRGARHFEEKAPVRLFLHARTEEVEVFLLEQTQVVFQFDAVQERPETVLGQLRVEIFDRQQFSPRVGGHSEVSTYSRTASNRSGLGAPVCLSHTFEKCKLCLRLISEGSLSISLRKSKGIILMDSIMPIATATDSTTSIRAGDSVMGMRMSRSVNSRSGTCVSCARMIIWAMLSGLGFSAWAMRPSTILRKRDSGNPDFFRVSFRHRLKGSCETLFWYKFSMLSLQKLSLAMAKLDSRVINRILKSS